MINKRIVEIRKDADMTQQQFADRMGISKNYVNLIENGKKNPGDRLLADICREFDINKEWLYNGTGKKKIDRPENQELSRFLNDVVELPSEDFKKRFIKALSSLNSKDWETLEKIVSELSKED